MKKIFIILALVILPLFSYAESYKTLSFDIGYVIGRDLDIKDGVDFSKFAINVKMSENISVGAMFLNNWGADTSSFVTMKYHVIDPVRTVITLGTHNSAGGTVYGGLGLEVVPASKQIRIFTTEFKVTLDYLASLGDFAKGQIQLGLGVGVGI